MIWEIILSGVLIGSCVYLYYFKRYYLKEREFLLKEKELLLNEKEDLLKEKERRLRK